MIQIAPQTRRLSTHRATLGHHLAKQTAHDKCKRVRRSYPTDPVDCPLGSRSDCALTTSKLLPPSSRPPTMAPSYARHRAANILLWNLDLAHGQLRPGMATRAAIDELCWGDGG